MSHFSRKAYTNVKTQLRDDDMDPILLSGMDTIFMTCYAVGSFFSGNIGDTYHAPTVVGVGLVGSGLCVAALVAGIWADLPHGSAVVSQAFFMVRQSVCTLHFASPATLRSGPVRHPTTPRSLLLALQGVWLVHGLLQSVGGPVGTSIMGNWFSARNRGYVFGTWTCHQYVGNIMAALVSSFVISTLEWDWTYALAISAVSAVLCGAWCVYALPECPEDVYGIVEGGRMHNLELLGHEQRSLLWQSGVGVSRDASNGSTKSSAPTTLNGAAAPPDPSPSPTRVPSETTALLSESALTELNSPTGTHTPVHLLTGRHLPPATTTAHLAPAPPPGGASPGMATITFTDALRIPNVAGYAMAFGFFKLVNYAMFFWLPYFLALHYSPSQSNLVSVLYDVGMMPGGIIVGWISDALGGRRACVIAVFMTLLAPLLVLFAHFAETIQPVALLLLLGVMGILIGGPNNIITSAVAADLADHPSVKGNAKALGTVTGIINGSGSVVAALGLLVIGPLQIAYGWNSVWYFLVLCVVTGTLLMSPKVIKELYHHQTLTIDAAIPIRGSTIGTPRSIIAAGGDRTSAAGHVELGSGASTNGSNGHQRGASNSTV